MIDPINKEVKYCFRPDHPDLRTLSNYLQKLAFLSDMVLPPEYTARCTLFVFAKAETGGQVLPAPVLNFFITDHPVEILTTQQQEIFMDRNKLILAHVFSEMICPVNFKDICDIVPKSVPNTGGQRRSDRRRAIGNPTLSTMSAHEKIDSLNLLKAFQKRASQQINSRPTREGQYRTPTNSSGDANCKI